jgi:hypothetical protein
LYKVQNGNADLIDGTLQMLDEEANNGVDENDATKLSNLYENFGIRQQGTSLSLEIRKPFEAADTVHYQTNQLKQSGYRFEFVPQNMVVGNGIEALILDQYLGTATPVSLAQSSTFDFVVNAETASSASDRFKLIFRQLRPLPVTFVEVKAAKVDKKVLVSWKVENEMNIVNYTVERSVDGRRFFPLGNVRANGSTDYDFTDNDPTSINYYRIRSNGANAETKYSAIVKVSFEATPAITVYPNPVKEDGKTNIKFSSKSAGDYEVKLLNALGQVVKTQVIKHTGIDANYAFSFPLHMSHGHYTLEINGKDGQKTRLKILF